MGPALDWGPAAAPSSCTHQPIPPLLTPETTHARTHALTHSSQLVSMSASMGCCELRPGPSAGPGPAEAAFGSAAMLALESWGSLPCCGVRGLLGVCGGLRPGEVLWYAVSALAARSDRQTRPPLMLPHKRVEWLDRSIDRSVGRMAPASKGPIDRSTTTALMSQKRYPQSIHRLPPRPAPQSIAGRRGQAPSGPIPAAAASSSSSSTCCCCRRRRLLLLAARPSIPASSHVALPLLPPCCCPPNNSTAPQLAGFGMWLLPRLLMMMTNRLVVLHPSSNPWLCCCCCRRPLLRRAAAAAAAASRLAFGVRV